MKSKWFKLKPKAIKLRQEGTSLREVEKALKVPRSTLSGWFKHIKLTKKHQNRLKRNWLSALDKARRQAVRWHNQQKELRIKIAEKEANNILANLNTNDPHTLELALAMLYLGEGLKTKSGLGIGNSDPLILKFFVNILVKNFNVDINRIKCSLHLRADQNPEELKRYWSKQLNLPVTNFTSPSIDQRTTGRPTYNSYHGVCVVQCGNIAIQRKLLFLSRKFCESIIR